MSVNPPRQLNAGVASKVGIVPERLTEGREARGLSMADLGNLIGVTRQAISKYELGEVQPSNVFDIARVLDFPLGFFSMLPRELGKPLGSMYFRRQKSASVKARTQCRVRVEWLTDIIEELEKYIEFPATPLPEVSEVWSGDSYTSSQIEDAAFLCRRIWKLSEGPISDVTLACENNGIIVSRMQLGVNNIDAFSVWYGSRPVIFLGSDKESAVRSRFDAAHELGHMILHHGLTNEDIDDPITHSRIEKEANRFASAFLMPADVFKSEFLSTKVEYLLDLKKRWGVSLAALIYRAKDLSIISDDDALNLRKRLSFYGYRKREPLDDQIPHERPRLLRRSITLLVDNGLVTKGDLLAKFKLPPVELEYLCGLDRGYFSDGNSVVDLSLKVPKLA